MANGHWFLRFSLDALLDDPALKLCCTDARWLWLGMLRIAFHHDPPGYVANGRRGLKPDQLSRLIGWDNGWDNTRVNALLNELEDNGVFSRVKGEVYPVDEGTIFSRRMVRDYEAFTVSQQHGKRGGNPLLLKDKNTGVNPPRKKRVKAEIDIEEEIEGRKRPSQKGSFSSVQEGSDTETPREQGAARVASLEVASLPRPPTFEEFKAAYPFNWGEVSEHDQKIYLERWRNLDDDEKRLAVSEIPTLLAWVNEAASDPERMIFYPETWLGHCYWREVWRRAPHLNPNARTNPPEQPESENAA